MKKILALILAAVMCMALVACGGNSEETTAETTAVETTADEAVAETTDAETTDEKGDVPVATYESLDDVVAGLETVLDVLKSGDVDALVEFGGTSTADMDESTAAMIVAMFSKLDYSFGTPVDAGDGTATVKAEITTVDINGVLMAYITEAANHVDETEWDADGAIFISMMGADDAATATSTVTVNFEQIDGEWTLSDDNEEFISALYGGLM